MSKQYTAAGFNRGTSEQKVATPQGFVDYVAATFFRGKPFAFDLAADDSNAKAPEYFTEHQDALKRTWPRAQCWLNPPYSHILPWAKKCQWAGTNGTQIAFLVPAAVGSKWFYNHAVLGGACVKLLHGRLIFEGHTAGYNKDLILCLYGEGFWTPGKIEVWDWRPDAPKYLWNRKALLERTAA